MRCMTGKNILWFSMPCNLILARMSPVKENYTTWRMIWTFVFFSCNGLHDRKNGLGIYLVNISARMVQGNNLLRNSICNHKVQMVCLPQDSCPKVTSTDHFCVHPFFAFFLFHTHPSPPLALLLVLVAPYRAILQYYRCDIPYPVIPLQAGWHSASQPQSLYLFFLFWAPGHRSRKLRAVTSVVWLMLGKKATIHRPAPVQNFALQKEMGFTEERFRWWLWFSWFL